MSDNYNFGQLTKEMVAGRLKDVPDAPAVAAEIARKTIVAGVRGTRGSSQEPRETVRQICFGAMQGLLLIDKDLPAGAVQILRCMAEVSQELHHDPSEIMTWALEGIALMSRVIPAQSVWEIRNAVEEAFQGTGEVFSQLCDQAPPTP